LFGERASSWRAKPQKCNYKSRLTADLKPGTNMVKFDLER
jgi:hypothetical protein